MKGGKILSKGGEPMSIFETLTLMIAFATLIAVVIIGQKK